MTAGPGAGRDAVLRADLHAGHDAEGDSDCDAGRVLGARVDYAVHAPVRLAGPTPDGLTDHRRRHGPRPRATGPDGERLIDTLDLIRLSGRGGGHFPAPRASRPAPRTPRCCSTGPTWCSTGWPARRRRPLPCDPWSGCMPARPGPIAP